MRIRNTVGWNLGLNKASFQHSAPVPGVMKAVNLQWTCGRTKPALAEQSQIKIATWQKKKGLLIDLIDWLTTYLSNLRKQIIDTDSPVYTFFLSIFDPTESGSIPYLDHCTSRLPVLYIHYSRSFARDNDKSEKIGLNFLPSENLISSCRRFLAVITLKWKTEWIRRHFVSKETNTTALTISM